MKVICLPRAEGKTSQLIQMASDLDRDGVAYIVVPTQQDVENVQRTAERLGVPLRQPMTFRDFLAPGSAGRFITHFLIDDLDRCLAAVSRVPIAAVSFTSEDPG